MSAQTLLKQICSHESLIGIIGLGYVGLPLADAFLKAGFRVLGFDVDPNKIELINKGKSYISTVSSEQIAPFVEKQKLEATLLMNRLLEPDVLIVCVPTPLTESKEPDLSFIISTSEMIQQFMRKGQIVVLESTTYPGTTSEVVLPILLKSNLKVGEDFFLGFSPERENPGSKDYTTVSIPKIVSGHTKTCLDLVIALYQQAINTVIPVSSTEVAEMAKLVENIYRCVNIALVNELKMLCHRMNLNIHEVLDAAATKPFGFQKFVPGPGLGGHCIPLDPYYLSWKAKQYDFSTRFIELAGDINANMPYYVIQKVGEGLNEQEKSLKSSSVLVVGISYKKDIDDLRESPALKIIELLQEHGAKVSYHDPYFSSIPDTRKYRFGLSSVELNAYNIGEADCVLIVTDHSSLDYGLIIEHAKLIVDTRNATKGVSSKNIVMA